jgi:hypothetical protein
MRYGYVTTYAVLASAIATLATASLAAAQERAGVVTTLEGKVTVVRASSSELTPLKFRDAIFVRDRIATGKESFARILLGGKAVVTIREFSAVTITEVPGVATVTVGSGRVAVAVARERMRPGDLVEVRTPNAVAGIRGTVIVAEVFDAQRSVITVLKGVIDVTRLDAGRAAGPATVLNALQQVTITGPNPVSAPQPISIDAAQKMGADFRSAPPRSAPSATTAAVSQGEVERAAKDMGSVAVAPVATAPVSAAAKGKTAQSDQSGGDSDKGKSNQSGTATVSAGSGSSVAATRGGGTGGRATSAPVATAPPASAAVISPATPVVPAMLTSSQGVTQKVLDSIKEALKDAKDAQRENRNKGRN